MFLLQIGKNLNERGFNTKGLSIKNGPANLPPAGTNSPLGTPLGTNNLQKATISKMPGQVPTAPPVAGSNPNIRFNVSPEFQSPSISGTEGASISSEANKAEQTLGPVAPPVSANVGGTSISIQPGASKQSAFGSSKTAAYEVSKILEEAGFDLKSLTELGLKGKEGMVGTVNKSKNKNILGTIRGGFGKGPAGQKAAGAAVDAINEKLKLSGKPIRADIGKNNKIIFNIVPGGTTIGDQSTTPGQGGTVDPTTGERGGSAADQANTSGNELITELNDAGIETTNTLLPGDLANSKAAQDQVKKELEDIKNIDTIVNQDIEKERARGMKELNDQLLVNMRNQTRKLRKLGFASSNIAGDYLEQSVFNTFEKGQNDLSSRLDQFGRDRRTELNNQSLDRIKTAAGITPGVAAESIKPKTAPVGSFADPIQVAKLAQSQSQFEAAQTREAKLAILNNLIQTGVIPKPAGGSEALLDSVMSGASSIAGLAAGMCWIAKEIFGSWTHPNTLATRNYISNIGPKWFKKFYISYGESIARYISNKPLLKALIRPLFELFSLLGKQSVVQGY